MLFKDITRHILVIIKFSTFSAKNQIKQLNFYKIFVLTNTNIKSFDKQSLVKLINFILKSFSYQNNLVQLINSKYQNKKGFLLLMLNKYSTTTLIRFEKSIELLFYIESKTQQLLAFKLLPRICFFQYIQSKKLKLIIKSIIYTFFTYGNNKT